MRSVGQYLPGDARKKYASKVARWFVVTVQDASPGSGERTCFRKVPGQRKLPRAGPSARVQLTSRVAFLFDPRKLHDDVISMAATL